tara:strand:+ start:373 stop:543 length:171 start_codon:yes stop_codon:yes gene_type:complete
VPDEEIPEYINLWDGPDLGSAEAKGDLGASSPGGANLIGYYLYKVSDHGLIYKEEE